jgi:hypothetical protein
LRQALPVTTLALVLAGAPALAARSVSNSDTGDTAGLALLRNVRTAYAKVPGVAIRGSADLPGIGLFSALFVQVLRRSKIVAEQADVVTGAESSTLVKRLGARTFAHDSGQSCWKALAGSDPRDLSDVGLTFLGAFKQRVEKPRRSGADWRLRAHVQDTDGTTGTLTYVIDRSSFVVKSAIARVYGQRIVDRFKTLHSRPKLATPTPRC